MKKVKETPNFLSSVQGSRPAPQHFNSSFFDQIASNENFMSKLREASKFVMGEMKSETQETTTPIPVIVVKNDKFLEKMKNLEKIMKLEEMLKPSLPQIEKLKNDFLPSASDRERGARFLFSEMET